MNIIELKLRAADLRALHHFYTETLELPASFNDPATLDIQVGRSRLVFAQHAAFTGRYHFAFDVPDNQLAQAGEWLEARVPLVQANDGTVQFHSDSWNADQFYFLDPAGNILELIARHSAGTARDTPFSSASVLAVTEIGLATPDVPTTVGWLRSTLRLEPYKEYVDTFTPVGDEHGLFIVVANGREWYPDTGVAAEPLPVEATIAGAQPGVFEAPGLPYRIQMLKAES